MKLFEGHLLGRATQSKKASAHVVHYSTYVRHPHRGYQRVIYKENKHPGHKGEHASHLEVAFSAIAEQLMNPYGTLSQSVVIEESGQIVGVTSTHASHNVLGYLATHSDRRLLNIDEISRDWPGSVMSATAISVSHLDGRDEREKLRRQLEEGSSGLEPEVMALVQNYKEQFKRKQSAAQDPEAESDEAEYEPLDAQDIRLLSDEILSSRMVDTVGAGQGFQFLDKMPEDFFVKLLALKDSGKVNIDMRTLADVFCTAYALEEDDLHKGNIGFFVTQGEGGVPTFHFFKIDHDLMFSDKIMSTEDARAANLSYGENAFQITKRDLEGFPDLKDSGNHYWPTRKVLIKTGPKAYHSDAERKAYASLKKDPEFQLMKWERFFKIACMPPDSILTQLKPHFDMNDSAEVEEMTRVFKATMSRMDELRTQLLSSMAFRERVMSSASEFMDVLVQELKTQGVTEIDINQYKQRAQQLIVLCKEIKSTDNYLSIAILSGSYRVGETLRRCRPKLKKSELESALETAKIKYEALVKDVSPNARRQDPRIQCYANIILELLSACKTIKPAYAALRLQVLPFSSNAVYSLRGALSPIRSLKAFLDTVQEIRCRPYTVLKEDQQAVISLVQHVQLDETDLKTLLDKMKSTPPSSPLGFMKEDHTSSWLLRKFRGTYADTDASKTFIFDIKKALKRRALAPNSSPKDPKEPPSLT